MHMLQSDRHHWFTAAEGCRNSCGFGAFFIFFFLLCQFIWTALTTRGSETGSKVQTGLKYYVQPCQRRSSPWQTPFYVRWHALKGQPTANSEPWGIIFIRGTFPTAGRSSPSFVSMAAVVPLRWGRIFWWPTDCWAESSDQFVFIHRQSVYFPFTSSLEKNHCYLFCLHVQQSDVWILNITFFFPIIFNKIKNLLA